MSPRRRPSPAALRLALVCGLLAWSSTACGYSTSRLTGDGGGHTIAVVPFTNNGFRRNLEMRLTTAVLERLRGASSFGIASQGSADYVMEGAISANEGLAIVRGDRTAIQKQYRGVVSVNVKDRRTGKVVRAYTVMATPEFTPGEGGETLEGTATDELVRRLAVRIVQGLERGF